MNIESNPERFSSLVAALHEQSLEHCLPYPGMTDVPVGYSQFAELDAVHNHVCWDDSCPAYALALLTFGGYRLPEDSQSMEILWDELGGASTKLWSDVAAIVTRAWEWLSRISSERGVEE